MTERSRQNSFNDWYGRNATDFNARRRERYHSDPTIRVIARQRAAEYRQRASDVVPEPRNGLNTSARVAAYLDISPQTLRNWSARYLIPKALYGTHHRLYTDHQMELLKAMVIHPTNSDEFKDARRQVFKLWGGANE